MPGPERGLYGVIVTEALGGGTVEAKGAVVATPVLGGLHHRYSRVA